ncbi:MAG: penicillin-binding protein activator [Pseudomonadales bacterium]
MSARPIAAWLLILAAWGCQSTPPSGGPAADDAAAGLDDPQALLDAAAGASSSRSSRLYLEAAEQLLNDGSIATAATALEQVEPARLGRQETARYLLARAGVALAQGDLDTADAALAALEPRQLREPMNAVLLQAYLLARQGRPAAAVRVLVDHASARGDVEPTAAGQRLNDAIWSGLGQVPAFEFLAPSALESEPARGWWLLKAQMLQSFTLADQRRRLASWQQAWPQHPAALQPPTALLSLGEVAMPVRRVGLLLPLSGPLSRAGRAVRDAFIATYLSHADDVAFEVDIYDVTAEPLATIYERALVNGADVLIGPLSRESVAQMNQLNPEVPVLALNYLGDELPAPNLLQLGLAIEDEAATLARWLNDRGAGRLLVFHNDEEWSTRAMQAVARDWKDAIDVQALRDIRTVTESVGAAMHVTASRQRRSDLEELLRQDLEFQPRARGDVDAIVALVSSVEVGALVPALRFHFAQGVPVFATSQTVRGVPRQQLANLNGFHLSELPWFVVDIDSYRTMNDAFALDGNAFVSLYALGVDAFRLAERAPLILAGSFNELLGSTGVLQFAANGRINRSLARTVVRRGTLEAVSASSR